MLSGDPTPLMKQVVANWVASLTNFCLTKLRNGVDLHLTREEIRFSRISFSQFGEEEAVQRWMGKLCNIPTIYVDVGCFHPIHCSNTLLLYKAGWRGVNVDMSSDRIALFRVLRPADYNVSAAVSSSEQDLKEFRYEGGLTDRLGKIGDSELPSVLGEKPTSSHPIRTRTLNNLLGEAPWPIDTIGYLNVDCEGHDLEVIKGLDLARYRPAILTIEAYEPNERAETIEYLASHGYEHKETLFRTLVFVRGELISRALRG